MLVSYMPLAAFCAPVPFCGIRASTLHATAQKASRLQPEAARKSFHQTLPSKPRAFKSTMAEDYQEALHEVNAMLQGFDDLDAPSRRLDVLRTPGPADAFPAAALDSPPRPPPSAVAAAQAPATEDTVRRKKPPSPPLYAWESRTAPGAPRVDHIETHAGVFEATATPGLYAAADIDDDDAARAYVDVQVVLTRTEAAEVRALQRRAAKASPPRDTAFMHSSTPYVAPRPVSYRPEAKGLPRWNV